MDSAKLKNVPLFAGLPETALEELDRLSDQVTVAAGRHIADNGDFAYDFFIIQEGNAEVYQDDVHIATLGPGQFFGELGLLEADKRTASVVAASPMRLIVMFERDFKTMEETMPEVAIELHERIKERLEA